MSKRVYKPFRFKRFSVAHTRSAHKVGVDGVLVGLWTPLPQPSENTRNGSSSTSDRSDGTASVRILDVGCGSGVISLIIAQRLSDMGGKNFSVLGIDIDEPSVEEAAENFSASEWSANLRAELKGFEMLDSQYLFDLIVSNPPYFDSGIANPDTRRERARHQSLLSPESLIDRSEELLSGRGILSMIIPLEREKSLIDYAVNRNLKLTDLVRVKGHPEAPAKRTLLAFRRAGSIPTEAQIYKEIDLILETAPGHPTEEYRRLGSAFYLYF